MAKPPLDRQAYINAALEVIAEVGVEQLSLRKVASRLGVTAMAMYKHFSNREELLSEALDAFIDRSFELPDEALSWEDWTEAVGRGMYEALCQEMSWVPLLGSLRLGRRAASVTDTFVRKLCAAGFTPEQAIRAYFAVIQTVVGAVCIRASLSLSARGNDKTSSDLAPTTLAYLQELDSARLRIAPALDTVVKQEQIDITLPLLLNALRLELAEGRA